MCPTLKFHRLDESSISQISHISKTPTLSPTLQLQVSTLSPTLIISSSPLSHAHRLTVCRNASSKPAAPPPSLPTPTSTASPSPSPSPSSPPLTTSMASASSSTSSKPDPTSTTSASSLTPSSSTAKPPCSTGHHRSVKSLNSLLFAAIAAKIHRSLKLGSVSHSLV